MVAKYCAKLVLACVNMRMMLAQAAKSGCSFFGINDASIGIAAANESGGEWQNQRSVVDWQQGYECANAPGAGDLPNVSVMARASETSRMSAQFAGSDAPGSWTGSPIRLRGRSWLSLRHRASTRQKPASN